MEHRTDATERPDRKKVTTKPTRAQLERALEKTLEKGTEALPQQVRYILALSQMLAIRPTMDGQPESPATVSDARLAALVEISSILSPEQRKNLYRDVQNIHDDDIRLQLSFSLMALLQDGDFDNNINRLWKSISNVDNPVTRSQLAYTMVPLLDRLSTAENAAGNSPLTRVIQIARELSNADARVRSLLALSYQLSESEHLRLVGALLDEVDATNNDNLRANTINALVDRFPESLEERILETAAAIHDPSERARAYTALSRSVWPSRRAEVSEHALEAIGAIANEDERTSALIAFAPHLEPVRENADFPEIMEYALTIAITLTRRNVRARALVALAPHLTLDLQGEALAAVHSLSSERERAMLLAELAPTLPPNMLVASLAVAHTMREQDMRVHALTVLAHYAPPQARTQTLLDALAAASNLPHHYERVTALLALVDILPPQLTDQAFNNALETTRRIDNENARSRALSLLGSHLPDSLIIRALDLAYEIEDPQQQLNALTGILPRLRDTPKRDALRQALECVGKIPAGYKQGRALVSVASHLTPEFVPETTEIAHTLDDPYDRVNAYIALAQNLPPGGRPELVSQAWEWIKEIDDGYDRSSALSAITPFLPLELRGLLASEAEHVIQSIDDEYDRASAITILAPLLTYQKGISRRSTIDPVRIITQGIYAALEIQQQSIRLEQFTKGVALWKALDAKAAYTLWSDVAKQLTQLPLADTLLCLGALQPIFREMAGEEGLKNIAHILGVR